MDNYFKKLENQYNVAVISGDINKVKELTPVISSHHTRSNIQDSVNVSLLCNYLDLAMDYNQLQVISYLIDFCKVRHSFIIFIPSLINRSFRSSVEVFKFFRIAFPDFYNSTLQDKVLDLSSILDQPIEKIEIIMSDVLKEKSFKEKINWQALMKKSVGNQNLTNFLIPLLKDEEISDKIIFDSLLYEFLYYEDQNGLNSMIKTKGVEILQSLSRVSFVDVLKRNKGFLLEQLIVDYNYIPPKETIDHLKWYVEEYERDAKAIPNSLAYTNSVSLLSVLEKKQFADKLDNSLLNSNNKKTLTKV